MNNKLHKFLDCIIKTVEDDIPQFYNDYNITSFTKIVVNKYKNEYFEDNLMCLSIFGIDNYGYYTFLNNITFRTEDMKNEFENNIYNIVDYIEKPLNDFILTYVDED